MARRRIKGKAKRGGSYGGGCGGFASSSQAQAMALAHSQGSSTSGLASSIAFTLVQGIELVDPERDGDGSGTVFLPRTLRLLQVDSFKLYKYNYIIFNHSTNELMYQYYSSIK